MKQISFAVTTHNRFELTVECINSIIDDDRVSEVIISDDLSTDGSYELFCYYFNAPAKVKIYQNAKNVDCYENKKLAIERCSNEYVIIADSDNTYSKGFIDKIRGLKP